MMNDTLKINKYRHRRGYSYKSCYSCKNVINKIYYHYCTIADNAAVNKDYICSKFYDVWQISIEID
jgi:hypothetical protein